MRTYIKNIFILCIILLTASCRGIYEDATEMAADYKSVVKSITVADLQAKTDKGESFLLIDVRQPDEYLTDNIPGSVSIPKEGNIPTYAVLEDGIFTIKGFEGEIVKTLDLNEKGTEKA